MTGEVFPDTDEGWFNYRRQLVKRGSEVSARLCAATSAEQRIHAEEEFNRVVEQTRSSEAVYAEWRQEKQALAFAADVEDRTSRLREASMARDGGVPRDPSWSALSRTDSPAGPSAVTLDEEGERLSQLIAGGRAEREGLFMRISRREAMALIAMLDEFAMRLMVARAAGDVTQGDAYVQALMEAAEDLHSRPFHE